VTIERVLERERPLVEALAQREAVHELHRDEHVAARLAGLEERGNGRMLEPGARLRFPDQPLPKRRLELPRKQLERRRPAQGDVTGPEDLSHSTGAQPLLDAIVGDHLARRDHREPDCTGSSRRRWAQVF
jgi:hypothetical protein